MNTYIKQLNFMFIMKNAFSSQDFCITRVALPWCFHLDMPRNKSRGTKSRGAICFLSADNARNLYQLSISQFEIIAV